MIRKAGEVFDFNQKSKSFILIPSLTKVFTGNGGRMRGEKTWKLVKSVSSVNSGTNSLCKDG